MTPQGPVSSAIWITSGCQAWVIHWPQGNICGTKNSHAAMAERREQRHRHGDPPADAAHDGREQQEDQRAYGAEQHEHPGRRDPREAGEALRDVDQPVEAAAGLDDARPPAEQQRAVARSGARSTAASMGTAAIQAAADQSNGVQARNQRQPLNVARPRPPGENSRESQDWRRITLSSDRRAAVRGECAS